MPLWLYFLSFLFCSVLFLNSNFIYYTSVAVFDFYYHSLACNLTERENFQNSDCPFRFLFEDFRLCSRCNNFNYDAWNVYKPLFGCPLLHAGSLVRKFHFMLTKKSYRNVPEKVGHSPIWQMT